MLKIDQAKIKEIVERIYKGNEDPHKWIEITYAIDEEKFRTFPLVIQEMLSPAIIVEE